MQAMRCARCRPCPVRRSQRRWCCWTAAWTWWRQPHTAITRWTAHLAACRGGRPRASARRVLAEFTGGASAYAVSTYVGLGQLLVCKGSNQVCVRSPVFLFALNRRFGGPAIEPEQIIVLATLCCRSCDVVVPLDVGCRAFGRPAADAAEPSPEAEAASEGAQGGLDEARMDLESGLAGSLFSPGDPQVC